MQRRQLLQVSTAAIGAISLAGCTINSSGESGESRESEESENSEADTDNSSPEENTESSESSDTADSSESSDESDSDSSDSDDEVVPESVDSVEAVDESNSVERPENGVETQEGTFSIDSDSEYGYHSEPIWPDEPTIIRWSITNERSPEHDFDIFFFTESQLGVYERVTQKGEDEPIRYVSEGTVLGLEESAERTVRVDPGEYFLVIDATEFGEAGADRENKTIELTMKLEAWDA